MRAKRHKSTMHDEEPAGSGGTELPEGWSPQRKAELVVRLLRGESLEDVSRESQIQKVTSDHLFRIMFIKL